jgi:hypothetical protein
MHSGQVARSFAAKSGSWHIASVLLPLIGARLHGWLDELVAILYVLGIYVLHLHGLALGVAIGAAIVHFSLARFTRYPQGTWGVISFRTHGFIELAEGLTVLAALWLVGGDAPLTTRAFLAIMGTSQLVAFSFSDYRWPVEPRA